MKTVLFINHNEPRCGVFQFGDIIGHALVTEGKEVNWLYSPIMTVEEYWEVMNLHKPDAVIFNYHPATSSLASEVVYNTNAVTFGIVHEPSWFKSDEFLRDFDHLIVSGMNYQDVQKEAWGLFPEKALIYTNRTIPDNGLNNNEYPDLPLPELKIPTIGSFGFGFGGKGYERIIDQVQKEYDEANIRLLIPYARFGDEFGLNAIASADECWERLEKPGIKLTISHEFLDRVSLIRWLEGNTINCFFYDEYPGRGISSAVDFALAAKRPIALTYSEMFKHIKTDPSIRIEDASLKEIVSYGLAPIEHCYKWTEKNTAEEYEAIMKAILK